MNKNKIYTIPNMICIARLISSFAIYYLYTHNRNADLFILLTIIFMSDMLDGKLARALNCETRLGKFLDMLADNVLINLLLILFCAFPAPGTSINLTIVVISILRSIMTIRSALLTYLGHAEYSTGWFGQFNTTMLMCLLSAYVLAATIPEFSWYYAPVKSLIYTFIFLRVLHLVINKGVKKW